MRHTLYKLTYDRNRIVVDISKLYEDLIKAPLLRCAAITDEIEQKRVQLNDIKNAISLLQPQVDELEIEWDESNVANVPVTVVLFD